MQINESSEINPYNYGQLTLTETPRYSFRKEYDAETAGYAKNYAGTTGNSHERQLHDA